MSLLAALASICAVDLASSSAVIPSELAGKTPNSVINPSTSSAGVTSKAGFQVPIPSGAVCRPTPRVIYSPSRSSIGISSPQASEKSKVLRGAAR